MMDEPSTSFSIGADHVALGEVVDLTWKISEHYSGAPIHLPLRVMRGPEPGPAVVVTAAIHGDELNGTGIVRDLIVNDPPVLRRGTLVLIPVVNMLGFERHTRYMPDRRDLNRCFPGSPIGNLTARLAHAIFNEIITRCDYGIDLHTAANFRTNMPNVRADLHHPRVRAIAQAFGCELIINSEGPLTSLRSVATNAGCKTILVEAGEPWKIQPEVVRVGVQGIRNVLIALKMTHGDPVRPERQVVSHRTIWIRAAEAGLLHFHISPGERIKIGQPVATNTSLLGKHCSVLRSRAEGMVMGMTTLPSVKPGDPVCHVALLDEEIVGNKAVGSRQ